MGFAFNPFTGNFDQKGSGGGGGAAFFTGEVATYADLPLDGTAPLDSRWLVRTNSGTWPFSTYKQAGVYVRSATVGANRDDDYTLTDTSFHDVMSDDAFVLFDEGDATKNLKFQLSGLTTGTTRTLTAPDASGTIARTEDFAAPPQIGSTTPNSGAFTTLTASGETELVNGGTTAGPFRLYNQFTSATNFERGKFAWESNILRIGTEKGSAGGTARALEFQTDGVTRMTVAASGANGTVSIFGVVTNRALATNSWAAVDSLNSSGTQVGGFGYGGTGVTNFPDQMYFFSAAKDLVFALAGNGTSKPIIINGTTGLLSFYGKTSSFPALKRNTTTLQVKLADDSAFTAIQGKLTTETAYTAGAPTATGYLVLYDSNGTAYKVPAEAL